MAKTRHNTRHQDLHRQITKALHEKKRREKRKARKLSPLPGMILGGHKVEVRPSVWGEYAAKRMGLD